MMDGELKRIGITISGNKKDFIKINSTFEWLKTVSSIPKKYLYFYALKWISEDGKAKHRFLQYLEKIRHGSNE